MEISETALRVARARLKETQAEFAKRFGVPQTTYANWELRIPRQGTARQVIARVLEELEG